MLCLYSIYSLFYPAWILRENGSTVTGTPALAAAKGVCKAGNFGSSMLAARLRRDIARLRRLQARLREDSGSDAIVCRRLLMLSEYISMVGGGGPIGSGGGR